VRVIIAPHGKLETAPALYTQVPQFTELRILNC
jgi:hypothetical protein